MSIGVWLLTVYAIIAVVFAFFWIPDELRRIIPLIGKWPGWSNLALHTKVGKIGLPFAVAIPVYSAVLLSVTSVPLWRNYLLPPMFFLSAVAVGFSAGILLSFILPGGVTARELASPLQFVQKALQVILSALLLVVAAFMISGIGAEGEKNPIATLIGGWVGILWWGGVIGTGIVFPLIFSLSGKLWSGLQAVLILLMVLTGGLALRWVVVTAGQM